MRLALTIGLMMTILQAMAGPLAAQAPATGTTPGSPASNGNQELRIISQNHYRLLRYDEDWSFLRSPVARRAGRDFWDPLKYVPLDAAGSSYLSFGGESRDRYEYISLNAYGRGPVSKGGYFLQRYLLHADAHFGPDTRLFFQFGSSLEDGRRGGPRPVDRDPTDVVQLFADQRVALTRAASLTLRVGRQEMAFGSGRLVGTGEGANIPTRFDGGDAIFQTPRLRVDTFDTRPTASSGVADGAGQYRQQFWGVYATAPEQFGRTNGLDVYYLDFNSRRSLYDSEPGREERRSGGVRLFGRNGAVDYNDEFTYQWGTFGSGQINAYALQMDHGVSESRWPLSPRLGLRADLITGDQNPRDRDLQAFNPLFVAYNYFNQAAAAAPINILDIHPTLDLHPAHTVDVLLDWDFYWRESLKDGEYGPVGSGLLVPAGGSESKYVGSIPDFQVTWGVDRHITLVAAYARFFPGEFLRDSRLDQKVDYFTGWVDYKF